MQGRSSWAEKIDSDVAPEGERCTLMAKRASLNRLPNVETQQTITQIVHFARELMANAGPPDRYLAPRKAYPSGFSVAADPPIRLTRRGSSLHHPQIPPRDLAARLVDHCQDRLSHIVEV